ncbi:uncharacterized protein SPPG_05324 [Spizellomyces punctatus DAOM BR117]|uniref:3-oxoacyl-[acyl-carrier-protein] reductase n=1 Tax=Spizellomyces punctatus (strain DAOM BR117) TaxID=645134 RepID=A0A0L0HEQ8_SPIPD|nr:hypothetical protein, variant [Spizellomyces punctatus DAOM BR117]XP_016607991.1 uncharacterized protein SPPG_05324 [Spizellomyces punctatus DAOM BR117]KNC99950.1 hypothetical protein, variant [Spizellomyces punctatus DAOM BR117]KNC99951.1 hypothetical protein SPPG_05324 [Spizellomyces punctatus DAOM BR117]|eukprot:XP_016607990.1 hypothetical protein, variant [Spizellomyces punctatus DAOM BR117]
MPVSIAQPSINLSGKVALVTGGSRGIGAAICQELAACGASVAVNYIGSKPNALKVAESIIKGGRKAITVQGNVGNPDDAKRIVEETVQQLGRLDIVVNNAGIYDGKDFEKVTLEEYNRVLDVNLKGPFFLTQAAVPHLGPDSSVINISTCLTKTPVANVASYITSKGGVEALTRALAVELAPKGIRVNVVSPGTTDTDMLRTNPEEQLKQWEQQTPLKRLGKPEDVAAAVVFLASPQSTWFTGQNLHATGGISFAL